MRLRRYFGLFYGVLVLLLVALGVWWFIFLSHEGRHYEHSELARLAADSTSAAILVRSVPEIGRHPERELGEVYPDLVFRRGPGGVEVGIAPEALARIEREAGKHERMFRAEGIFFLALLAAASTILTLAYRSEREFNRARELFLAGATHELKTPLASLRLYTETLGRKGVAGAQAERIRARMLDDIERLEKLIDQILAVGYDESASRSAAEPFDPAAETRRILQDMGGFVSAHGAQIEADLPEGARIAAAKPVFALVVRNLITNAVIHSSAPARVRISLEERAGSVRLSVEDRGPGIPRKHRNRIFRGFAGTGEPPGGSSGARAGLGLYLVERQTKMMGGRVELVSDVGRGSTFTLVLPACEGAES